MRAKESVEATKAPTGCVCFLSKPVSLCVYVPKTACTSVCVYVHSYIYMATGVCWCSFPSVFLA